MIGRMSYEGGPTVFFFVFFFLSLFEPATSDIQHEFVIADIDLFHLAIFYFMLWRHLHH